LLVAVYNNHKRAWILSYGTSNFKGVDSMGVVVKSEAKSSKDALGDRMKMYEQDYAGEKIMPLLPICARLDGKGFSKFTKGMERPYDKRFRDVMKFVTTQLVKKASALVGYTQSDEISLIFYSDSLDKQLFFDRKIQKMVSVLTAMATFAFQEGLNKYMPEYYGKEAFFDCRVWAVPNQMEAVNSLVWRELDATKNSISMAAMCYYSHKQLMNKTGAEKQEMLFQKGINWNDYPAEFKRGVYIMRQKQETPFSAQEISQLPAKHEARTNPDLKVLRTIISEIDLPPVRKIKNKVEVFFAGAEPVLNDAKEVADE